MLNSIIHTFKYGNHTVTIETGIIANQTTSAVMVTMDETTVFVTIVCANKVKETNNFLPLIVNYQERAYAAGKFPGGFFRREGRPNESEILIARLIDRSIRPLFQKGFYNDIQIIATVMSLNPQINPDIVAIIGTSACLSLSGLPFKEQIGIARVGYIDDKYILNPTKDQLKTSSLNLIVASTENAILMVESESKFLNENQILNAIFFGHQEQQIIIENIKYLTKKINKQKLKWIPIEKNAELINDIKILFENRLIDIYKIHDKKIRFSYLEKIQEEAISKFTNESYKFTINEIEIINILEDIKKKIVRENILYKKIRIDGREKDMIRSLDIRIGILSRVHGSSLFTRGETQALVTTTLGTERDAQTIDDLNGERTDRFILHYNFNPYSVGEIGIIGSPKRREIGHGYLAKKSILPVMPNVDEFPYTVRIVSEITESNGSSSMATVCGASLALMDAGVPIKSAVAGVAMGLIKEGEKYVILSDILSDEDYLGDMDFKVAGNEDGISALQMDIKIEGITKEIIQSSLYQAKAARLHILNVMNKAINTPKTDISIFAPKIKTIKINPEKIKDIIGKGGSVIRGLTEQTNTIIEIEDDGTIKIAATEHNQADKAIKMIEEITTDLDIGSIYKGKITKILDFGVFVTIIGKKEGLVHISQIIDKRINKITDYLKLGQEVFVKVLEIDRQGRIRLSIKEAKKIS